LGFCLGQFLKVLLSIFLNQDFFSQNFKTIQKVLKILPYKHFFKKDFLSWFFKVILTFGFLLEAIFLDQHFFSQNFKTIQKVLKILSYKHFFKKIFYSDFLK
jgi:hypothetical protein